MSVIGLDLSLTSTGIAFVFPGSPPEVRRITSKGKAADGLRTRAGRLQDIATTVLLTIESNDPDLIVVESPAHGQVTGHHHDRSGLWWLVVNEAICQRREVVEVSPTALKKYATGKGNAGKDAVLAAVVRRYPNVEVTGNDEADALVLAAMGARHLGQPIDDLPKVNLAAMDGVRW